MKLKIKKIEETITQIHKDLCGSALSLHLHKATRREFY